MDPATISEIQGIVQKYTKDLKQGLTKAQSQIKAVRSELSQLQAGTLSPQTRKNLETLQNDSAKLQTTVASLEKSIKSAQDKVPSQLHGRLVKLESRLSDLDARLTRLEAQTAAVL